MAFVQYHAAIALALVDCNTMDRTAALRQLTDYLNLVDQAKRQRGLSADRRATLRLLNQRLMTVNQILKNLAPDFAPINARSVREHDFSKHQVHRARQLLENWGHVTEDLHPLCNGGPYFPLELLDPIVSHAAIPLWRAEKYRQAVGDAATNLNGFAQDRIRRHDISDKDLMAQAFSDKDPEPGKSRLRCPGNAASETVRSQQEGARAFAIGAFQVFRNTSHHMAGDWNPVTAFHHLAALSQIAHWFRCWDIVSYTPPPPDLSAINTKSLVDPVNKHN